MKNTPELKNEVQSLFLNRYSKKKQQKKQGSSCLKFYIGVQLICSVVFISGVQQSDLVIHSLFFFIFFSHIEEAVVIST